MRSLILEDETLLTACMPPQDTLNAGADNASLKTEDDAERGEGKAPMRQA